MSYNWQTLVIKFPESGKSNDDAAHVDAASSRFYENLRKSDGRYLGKMQSLERIKQGQGR
jgi:hypothetical protein